MVTGIWRREFNTGLMRVEYHKSSVFVTCLWQEKPEVHVAWLFYRIFIFMAFVFILIWSILNFDDSGHIMNPTPKWLIYLTHWGFTLCTMQFCIGMVMVIKQFLQERTRGKYAPVNKGLSPTYKVYWVTNTVALVMAIGITICYWGAIHKPKTDKITVQTCMVHIVNSVVMFIDFLLVAHPFRLLHSYWTFFFTVIYIFFTLIYFELGGTNPSGRIYIYETMNWSEPRKNLLSVLYGLIFVLALHTFIWLLYMLKRKIYRDCTKRAFPNDPITLTNREAIPLDIVI